MWKKSEAGCMAVGSLGEGRVFSFSSSILHSSVILTDRYPRDRKQAREVYVQIRTT
jgi:hypothetical protein